MRERERADLKRSPPPAPRSPLRPLQSGYSLDFLGEVLGNDATFMLLLFMLAWKAERKGRRQVLCLSSKAQVLDSGPCLCTCLREWLRGGDGSCSSLSPETSQAGLYLRAMASQLSFIGAKGNEAPLQYTFPASHSGFILLTSQEASIVPLWQEGTGVPCQVLPTNTTL